ncbi:MAG: 50S ribosomal protein L25, partial [Planctomycetota bacterium]|nr:50S ribosomal protein L25 [Planctomycetota bacterium]
IYGLGKENLTVTIDTKEFTRAFMSGQRIVTINTAGGQEKSVVKEVQYDGLGDELVHVDFTRIDIHQKITLEVALEIVGTVVAGVLEVPLKEVKVESLPAGFPSSIPVNITELKIGDVIRVEDLEAPEGCTFADEPETLVLQVTAPVEMEEEAVVEEGAEGESPDEPEVVGKPKDEDSEDAAEESGE